MYLAGIPADLGLIGIVLCAWDHTILESRRATDYYLPVMTLAPHKRQAMNELLKYAP